MAAPAPMPLEPAGAFLRWGNVVVPWTAAWSSEAARDRCDIRVERVAGRYLRFLCDGIETPGVGKPLFAVLHNERSRAVIHEHICQICRQKLRDDPICINQGEVDGRRPLINDGLPMCRPCAALAMAQCPGLQRAEAAGRLRLWVGLEWQLAPVLLRQVPEGQGGNPHVNALLAKERGMVFSGIKLVLTRFHSIGAAELRLAAAL